MRGPKFGITKSCCNCKIMNQYFKLNLIINNLNIIHLSSSKSEHIDQPHHQIMWPQYIDWTRSPNLNKIEEKSIDMESTYNQLKETNRKNITSNFIMYLIIRTRSGIKSIKIAICLEPFSGLSLGYDYDLQGRQNSNFTLHSFQN